MHSETETEYCYETGLWRLKVVRKMTDNEFLKKLRISKQAIIREDRRELHEICAIAVVLLVGIWYNHVA